MTKKEKNKISWHSYFTVLSYIYSGSNTHLTKLSNYMFYSNRPILTLMHNAYIVALRCSVLPEHPHSNPSSQYWPTKHCVCRTSLRSMSPINETTFSPCRDNCVLVSRDNEPHNPHPAPPHPAPPLSAPLFPAAFNVTTPEVSQPPRSLLKG